MDKTQALVAIAALMAAAGLSVGDVDAHFKHDTAPDANGDIVVQPTGNVYPRPRPDLGESFIGYYQRVTKGTANANLTGALMMIGGAAYGATADPQTWPGGVDRFLHGEAYMTPEQVAAQTNARTEFGSNMHAVAGDGEQTGGTDGGQTEIPIGGA